LGARVVVQVADHAQAVHYSAGSHCEIFAGSIEREYDATRVFDAARPQVVFHCTALDVTGVANGPEYLWRRLVRTTHALRVAVSARPIESMVLVNFWGGASGDDPMAQLSAAAEIMAINSLDLLSASPKILRFPGILTRRRLGDLMAGAGEGGHYTYAVLGDEAVAMCIDAAATYKGRVILVPEAGTALTASDVAAALSDRFTISAGDASRGARPLFPNEDTKAAILAGAREVISPAYPASDRLIEAVEELLSSSQNQRQDLSAVRAALFERAEAGRLSAD
jgi:hypothetical protein